MQIPLRLKQKTRLHHQHKNWERNHRDYFAKIIPDGENVLIDRIISMDRLEPYLNRHNNVHDKAISHYKSNILISEAFYPLLAILEIGLRNSIDYQLTKQFNDRNWYENMDFIRIASCFQIDRISKAKANILSEKKEIIPGRNISELSFGFWTSLFDTKFEMTLWKNLRLENAKQ